MKKLLMAGATGAALAYLFDGQQGRGRRRTLKSAFRHGQDATMEVGRQAARSLEPLTPVPTQVLDKIDGRGGRSKARVAVLGIGGSLLVVLTAGALAYLVAAVRSPDARRRLLQMREGIVEHLPGIGGRAATAGPVDAGDPEHGIPVPAAAAH